MNWYEGMLFYDMESETFFVTTLSFVHSTVSQLGLVNDTVLFTALAEDDRFCICIDRINR